MAILTEFLGLRFRLLSIPIEMSDRDATILCHLLGGPFDGQELEEGAQTQVIALQSSTSDLPLWAMYRRSEPDVIVRDDGIEFQYIGMKDRPF